MVPSKSRCRVLVVDDDLDIRESTAAVIRLLGHDVVTAGDGMSGVAEARRFRPELVLLDLSLPDVHGHDVVRHLRAEPWGPQALLAAMTGWVQESHRLAAVAAGFDVHVPKPVDLATLRSLIARASADSAPVDGP